jgi:hypothetical protein
MKAMKFTSMDPKNQFYHANGGGRDGYITHDNGGSCCRKPNAQGLKIRPTFRNNHVSLLNRTMVRPKQDAKVVSYQPDGSGRDNYVVTDAGGLKGVQMYGTDYSGGFVGGLRSYQRTASITKEMRETRSRSLIRDRASSELKNALREYASSVDPDTTFNQRKHVDFLSRPKRIETPHNKFVVKSSRAEGEEIFKRRKYSRYL